MSRWAEITILLSNCCKQSMDHEHGTVGQPILEHQIRLCALSSVISRHTCYISSLYAAADWWLSTVRPAPLWLFSEFGAVYKYSDLLTYFWSLSARPQSLRQVRQCPWFALKRFRIHHCLFGRLNPGGRIVGSWTKSQLPQKPNSQSSHHWEMMSTGSMSARP